MCYIACMEMWINIYIIPEFYVQKVTNGTIEDIHKYLVHVAATCIEGNLEVMR